MAARGASGHHRGMDRHARAIRSTLVAALLVAGCGTPSGSARSVELVLVAQGDSGVEGRVTLLELGPDRSQVAIEVDPAGHESMPAHIHAGSCDELVPQPKYALENVVDGRSTTEVPASLDALMAGDHALNLHRSNDEMDVSTACVDLS